MLHKVDGKHFHIKHVPNKHEKRNLVEIDKAPKVLYSFVKGDASTQSNRRII